MAQPFLAVLRSESNLLGLKLLNALEKNVPSDRQAPSTDFVECVFRRVPIIEIPARIVLEVNDIDTRDLAL